MCFSPLHTWFGSCIFSGDAAQRFVHVQRERDSIFRSIKLDRRNKHITFVQFTGKKKKEKHTKIIIIHTKHTHTDKTSTKHKGDVFETSVPKCRLCCSHGAKLCGLFGKRRVK